MTMPSSTSQSDLADVGGSSTVSFGPMIAEVALVKTIGSDGIGWPDSAAWSR